MAQILNNEDIKKKIIYCRAVPLGLREVPNYKRLFPDGTSTRFWVMASSFVSSQSHSFDTSQTVGSLRSCNQNDPETPTRQHTTLTRDRYPYPGWIRTRNPSKLVPIDPYLRPSGQRGRPQETDKQLKFYGKESTVITKNMLDENINALVERHELW